MTYDQALQHLEGMTQLTWKQLAALTPGARVVFVEPLDIFPELIVPAGTTATITTNDLNEIGQTMAVLPDSREIRHKLAEWNGEIYLAPQDGLFATLSPLAPR